MNWLQYTENKKKFLVTGIIILCLAMLLLASRRNVVSFDGYWHLQTGLDWLRYGLSPWIDHFSFTYNGAEVAGPPVIFQGLIAILVDVFGLEAGFQIYRAISFISVLILVLIFLEKLDSPTFIYALVLPMVVALLQYRVMSRPELLSYSFSVLAIMLYFQAGKKLNPKYLILMIGLIWAWTNYHTPLIGYVIFFGYFIDVAQQQLKENVAIRIWLQWLSWGCAIVLVGFLTPQFQHPLLSLFSFEPEWKTLIQEYSSPFTAYGSSPAFYILGLITFITVALLIIKQRLGLLISCCILIFSALNMMRMVSPAGIILLCVFAWMVKEVKFQALLPTLPKFKQQTMGIIILLVFAGTLWAGVTTPRAFMQDNKTTILRYPFDVVQYMKKNVISGRIFNEYGIGGYLIYELSPDSTVYIDGRTNVLYPLSHYKLHSRATASAVILQNEIEKYDINLTILENGYPSFSVLSGTEAMHLDYVGARFSLFNKNNPNFPLSGKLLTNPSCWQTDTIGQLKKEVKRGNQKLPPYSPLLPFMENILKYSQAKDKISYLYKQTNLAQLDDFQLRFLASQALRLEQYLLLTQFHKHIRRKYINDVLVYALANIHLGSLKEAKSQLNDLAEVPVTETHEKSIQHQLLEYIRKNTVGSSIVNNYMNRPASQYNNLSTAMVPDLPRHHAFCKSYETDW